MSAYQKYAVFLIALLIASLPFFSVRHPALVFSPPLLILMLISVSVMLHSILTVNLVLTLTKFDIAIIVYLGVVLINLVVVSNADGAQFAFIKTLIYVASYFCLKHTLQQLSLPQIETAAKAGVLIGSVLFLLVAIGCLIITGQINAITSFGYWSLTLSTFSAIDSVIGGGQNNDFEAQDIMRNAVAEAFTFYFLCTLVFKFKNQVINILILALNAIFVICTFSRRAFHAIAIVIFGGSFFDREGIMRGISMTLLIGSIVAATTLLQADPEKSRLTDMGTGGRIQQYVDAMTIFTNAPLFGEGFGSKLERGSYVHNFIFGSAAMLGISGLFAALYIYISTIFQFVTGLAKPKQFNTATFLVIPILGMTVGATFEGLFTITSWVAFSLYAVCSQRQEELETESSTENDWENSL